MAADEGPVIERRPSARSSNATYPPEWGAAPADPTELRSWIDANVADGERRKRRGEDVSWVGQLPEER